MFIFCKDHTTYNLSSYETSAEELIIRVRKTINLMYLSQNCLFWTYFTLLFTRLHTLLFTTYSRGYVNLTFFF